MSSKKDVGQRGGEKRGSKGVGGGDHGGDGGLGLSKKDRRKKYWKRQLAMAGLEDGARVRKTIRVKFPMVESKKVYGQGFKGNGNKNPT